MFQRGSEWRRWDLHVHTPGTIKNDCFQGTTLDEKWDKFYVDISTYIGNGSDSTKSISVIGITDYLSVSNYQKIISENRLPSSVSLVLPNVEMRIQPIASDSPINIHFLFNPQIIDGIETRFFSKLSFKHDATSFSASKSELIRLGKLNKPDATTDEAYRLGIEQFVPSFDMIQNVFTNDPALRNDTIILVSNSSNDGVSGAINHSDYFDTSTGDAQLKTLRQSIYKFVDGLFSATPSDIAFFLGKKVNCPVELVKNECGGLMPCVHGSDAHNNSALFEPDAHRYCWIKADPTFNGLKQIVYEPSERVCISEMKPEQKSDYLVIDRVELFDDDFQNEPVFFNDKLNCIIGGKSTGKSILLHNLALSLDRAQVEKKDIISQTRTKKDVKLDVYWTDGKSSKDYPSGERKVIYVPQTYLNRLCDTQTERTEIDAIIQDIVLLNSGAKQVYDKTMLTVKNYKPEVSKTILDLLETHSSISTINQQMKELGDKSGIEAEKEKLTKEKIKLAADSSLTEEEMATYENSTSKATELKRMIQDIDDELSAIKTICSLVDSRYLDGHFSEQTKTRITEAQKRIVEKADVLWAQEKTELLAILEEDKEKKSKDLTESTAIIVALKDKVLSNTAIAELTTKISAETEKLMKFEQYEKMKGEKEKQKAELLSRAVE